MNYLEKSAQISVIFIGLVIFFMLLKEFATFLRPFFIALILSFLLVPITRLSKQQKILTILNTLSVIIILSVIFAFIGTLFIDESSSYNQNSINSTTITLSNQDNLGFKNYILYQKKITIAGKEYTLSDFLKFDQAKDIVNNFINIIIGTITSFLSELFLILLFLGFILPSHDRIMNKFEKHIHKNESIKAFRDTMREIEKSIRTYLGIKTSISIGTAIISGIIMYFFNVPYLIIFMVMIFLLNFIPNIGSFIAVFTILFFYFLTYGFGLNLVLLTILLTLTQIFFGNILEPKIAGRELELSPILILLSLFFWGYIWGVPGMFFAVPLTSIIKIILQNIKVTKGIVEFLS